MILCDPIDYDRQTLILRWTHKKLSPGYFRRVNIDITEFGEIIEITRVIYFSKLSY